MLNKFINKHFKLFFGGIFFFVGLIFLLVSIFLFFYDYNFKQIAKETTATIDRIVINYNYNNKVSRDVYVKYFVDGNESEHITELNYYSSNMYEGDEIKIYYNPDIPNKIIAADTGFLNFIFILMGLIFSSIGVPFIISDLKDISRSKKLIKENYYINATIKELIIVLNIRINGRHPYVVLCSDVDYPNIIYKSGIINDSSKIIIGENIKVYIDRKNKDNYFVDIRHLQ